METESFTAEIAKESHPVENSECMQVCKDESTVVVAKPPSAIDFQIQPRET
jgi:hypothetical protein